VIAAPGRSTVQYPGGLAGRYRWAGSGESESVFSLTETGGRLEDHGPLVSDEPDRLCRAELRIEGPVGAWTARFASPIFDEPQGLLWDVPGLLLVKYGFLVYALTARTGDLRWSFRSGTPLVSVLGSPRLPHVVAQGEVETTALREDGSVAWRVAHSDVVVEAALIGGRLVLTSYGGQRQTLDPVTGRTAE
jgi:outer membrane protein assembly factor BamB